MPELDLLMRLGVALAIGLLVGLERGWHTRDEDETQRAAGLRTFALSGLLGGVAAALGDITHPLIIGIIFLGYVAAFAAFHLLEARMEGNVGATSVVAGMLTFVLGSFAVVGDLRTAIAAAVAMTLLLALREPLHLWVRRLTWAEIRAVLTLLAMTFLLLPVLPNRTVDPWSVLNPAEIWITAIAIAAISFTGYVAVRVLGDRLGIVAAAFTGGLASSTATTVTLARLAGRQDNAWRIVAGGILIASLVMVLRVLTVVAVIESSLVSALALPLTGIAATMALGAIGLLGFGQAHADTELAIRNPLDLSTTLKLAGFIAVVLLAVGSIRETAGTRGVLAVAALSGIADVDAITVSMARLSGSTIDRAVAIQAILVAVTVNTLAKAGITLVLGGIRTGAAVLSISATAITIGYVLVG